MSLPLLILGIVALLLVRVPVAFALLGPSLAYILLSGQSVGLSLRLATGGVNSFPLLAVPLFILVGEVANRAGIADRLYEFAEAIVGRVRASLAYVNIFVSMGFSWMSGAALADAAGLGKIEVPAMIRHGYPERFSVGVTAASSLLSPVMPPSIPAIIYASIAAVSTGALFAASVIPAILMAGGMVLVVYLWGRSRTDLEVQPFSWQRLRSASLRTIPPLGAPLIILGGILGGLFTPTEAAAVGAIYVLMLGLAYGKLSVRDLPSVFRAAATTTASITLILAGSALLGWILAREQVPQAVAEVLLGVTDSQLVFLIMANLLLLLLGMLIEPTSALVISVPILLPVAVEFGVDPLHFGVVVILNLIIGLLTPPIGAVLYVLSSATGIPVDSVFRGAAPFLIPLLVVLALITAVPSVVLFLPRLLGL